MFKLFSMRFEKCSYVSDETTLKKIQAFQDGWDGRTRSYLEQESCDLWRAGGEVECVLKHADADM